MTFTKINRSAATLTKNRTEGSISPFSGMCVTCVDGCIGMCEIGKSAYRGTEVLYPQPFGLITAAAEKDYPVDLSHFNIMGTAAGAWGVEADSDKATFEKVSIETAVGRDKGIKLRVPFIISGMGSTNVAKQNWAGLAVGAAIAGTILTVGENVCGMDEEAEIRNGRVVRSPDMEMRVRTFQQWYDGYGTVVVQANVEDTRLGVQEYVIEKLGVTAVELKWGQGAKI
jgi:glutamate synthase (NADPH) GltB2 subunit (EC 1.4.1.13)